MRIFTLHDSLTTEVFIKTELDFEDYILASMIFEPSDLS